MVAQTELEDSAENHGFKMEISIFDVGEELPLFLNSVLNRAEIVITAENQNIDQIDTCLIVVDQTINLLRLIVQDIDEDRAEWENCLSCFEDILQNLYKHQSELFHRPTTLTIQSCDVVHTGRPGRPSVQIQPEMLEGLLEIGFSQQKIALVCGVSRWTIRRRIQQYNLHNLCEFSDVSDAEIDEMIIEYTSRHGGATGEVLITGYLRSRGIYVQQRRVRQSMTRIDPANIGLRWGATVYRRKFQVQWANSLWHIDGHHSLIRWGIVIHGCIDGFSRRVIYFWASTNILSTTVLDLFLEAIEKDGGLRPSRIRVYYGVENVLVCDVMVNARGEGRASFIAGPSTHNQRIERLWRDVFRAISHYFYYIFYALEDSGLLNTTDQLHMFALHLVFLPKINIALYEFMEAYNHHKVRTINIWSPYQVWINSMSNPGNPMVNRQLDPQPENAEFFGYDPQGPNPFDNSDNNVVVHPISVEYKADLRLEVLESIDPLRTSNEMGIDIYGEALGLLQNMVDSTE